MKKISKLLALAVGFATLLFASCSDGDVTGTAANQANDKTGNEKEYGISLYAEDGTALDLTKWGVNAEAPVSAARTIVPAGIGADIEDTTKVKFYLWGNNQLNTSDTSISDPTAVAFKLDTGSTSKGSVTLGLSASRWNLTLAAVDATKVTGATPLVSDIKGAAYYIGYANVDLRSATEIKFYLSAEGLTGPGSVKLKFSFDGMDGASTPGTWSKEHAALLIDKSYTISADITSRLNNVTSSPQTIDTAKFLPTPTSTPPAPTTFAGTEDYTAAAGDTKTWTSVAPGTYNLEVTFTCPPSDDDVTKTYVWSDIIIVLPNQAIDTEVKVPDVVLYKPEKPATFKIGYEAASLNTLSNTYNAVMAWSDSSNNEKFFEVQYADLEGTANLLSELVDDDAKWTAATTSLDATQKVSLQTKTVDFYGNTKTLGWVAGSLVKNNKEAVVKLSLGRRYLFRIAAVNDAGHSDWTYATYDLATATQAISTGSATKSYTPKPYALKKIAATTPADGYEDDGTNVAICANLYRLTYHLNGGEYKFDGSTAKTTDLVYYLSQKPEPATLTDDGAVPPVITSGIPVFTPIGDPSTPTFPTLYKGTNSWTSWRRGIVEGTVYQNTAADRPAYAPTTPVLSTVTLTNSELSCYKPDGYLGYQNLDLFASYTVSSAKVEVYNDADYEFLDSEISLTGATSGAGHAYEFAYTSTTSATSITLNYTKDTTTPGAHPEPFAYDSMVVSIKNVASAETVAIGTVNPSSNSYVFDIAAFGEGKFYITVVGEYKGHQYSYGIVLNIVDNS